MAIIALLGALGFKLPLTEDSPVIQEQQADITHHRNEQLTDYIERDSLKLRQMQAIQAPTLLEQEIIIRYEAQIRKYMAELEIDE